MALLVLARPVMVGFPDRSSDEDAVEVTLDRSRRSTRPAARGRAPAIAPRHSPSATPSTAEPLALAPAPVAAGGPVASDRLGDLRAALRTGGHGCLGEGDARLTSEQRARCEEKLGALAMKTPSLPAPIDPAKRAYYDTVAEAYADRRRAMVTLDARGGRGMFAVDDSVHNGHGPKVGCSVKFGPNADKAPKGPANALRAGPCFIQPPVGSLTPEADIRKPY